MASDKPFYDVTQAEQLFEKYIKDHNKQYEDDADKQVHFRAFVESLHKINKLNAESEHATYGLNKFADHTTEEMSQMCGFKKPDTSK